MSYVTGSANDLTALRTALVAAAIDQGWAWNGGTEVLSKGTSFLRIQIVSDFLTFLGMTSAGAGSAPSVVRIGMLAGIPIAWPVVYEIFAFADEVYLVINYGTDMYQWAAFGKSSVGGMSGTGMFVGASVGAATGNIHMAAAAGGNIPGTGDRCCPGLFWAGSVAASVSNSLSRNCYVHHDFDGAGWSLEGSLNGAPVGSRSLAPLIALLPNNWNSEAVLLPIRCYIPRPESKVSLAADLEHVRITRIDNYTPGQVIQLGSDEWKVFPWFRKNTGARNGGNNVDHTGTFGWAIRYEEP